MYYKNKQEYFRSLICGTSGSGKTTLALFIISTLNLEKRPLIIINPKNDDTFNLLRKFKKEFDPQNKILQNFDIRDKNFNFKDGVCYESKSTDLFNEELTEDFLESLVINDRYHNAILFFDEGVVFKNRSPGLIKIFSLSRSKGVTVILNNQRPVNMPNDVIGNSSFIFSKKLLLIKDIEKIAENVGDNKENIINLFKKYNNQSINELFKSFLFMDTENNLKNGIYSPIPSKAESIKKIYLKYYQENLQKT